MSIKTIIRATPTATAIAIALALLFNTAWGQSFEENFAEGVSAYDEGDYETAFEVFQSLAVEGDAAAQHNLGHMYRHGVGVPQDYSEAVRWYRAAAEQGDAEAQNNLGTMYGDGQGVLQDIIAGHMWFNIASANGNQRGEENRDLAADRMSREAIEEAQNRARACMKSGYQDCD